VPCGVWIGRSHRANMTRRPSARGLGDARSAAPSVVDRSYADAAGLPRHYSDLTIAMTTEPVATPAAPVAPPVAAQRADDAVEPAPTRPKRTTFRHLWSSKQVMAPNIGGGAGETAAYAARYYQARAAPVQPQGLELMRRLHEIPKASGLSLQFGPHNGNTPGPGSDTSSRLRAQAGHAGATAGGPRRRGPARGCHRRRRRARATHGAP
jgi:hypothetical protein